MKFDTLGDYCKWLEKNFSPEIMIPKLPVIIRLDGNNFHNYTKKLNKPFDDGLNKTMVELTKFLVKETNAILGYTQSDEITLLLYSDNVKSAIYHEGKKQKILSKLSSKCSIKFNKLAKLYIPNVYTDEAIFDARIYQTPTLQDACNQFLWRELDATKNSISMVAQSLFPPKELQNLNSNQLQDKMMLEKNVNWNDFESRFKKGVYIKRQIVKKKVTEEELLILPEKHYARQNPDVEITRSVIDVIEYPIMSKIANRVEVIFYDQKPVMYEKDV